MIVDLAKTVIIGLPIAWGIVLIVDPHWPSRPPRVLGILAGLIGVIIAIVITETIW